MEEVDRSISKKRKQPLQLDWPTLWEVSDDPRLLLVVTSSADGGDPGGGGSPSTTMESDQGVFMDVENLSDSKIDEQIGRSRRTMEQYGRNLPDRGKKLRATIKRLEAEKERRKLRRVDQDANECVNSRLSTSLAVADASNVREEIMTDIDKSPSSTRLLSSRLDNADCRTVKECGESSAPSDQQGNGYDKNVSARGKRSASSLEDHSFQSPRTGSLSLAKNKQLLDGDQMGRASSSYLSVSRDHRYGTRHAKKKNGLDDSKTQDQTVVLDDEEDGQVTDTTEQANEVAECMRDATLYYPSRDDPGSVQICYKDIDCLAPEGYLTSPIMNFYITYLKRLAYSSDRGKCDYHFFNTFFYNKLQEAVSHKRNQKDGYFTKFRRWWKGVNIFEKAYMLIPINEDLHWSLAIISIPDKHDQSGPIILHLDSLQLHRCKPIFTNIKRFLVEEWKYLNQETASSNVPIADKVWERLPNKIGDKKIAVPQQKNEYDCGLFVLYFMQRLIEEASERLKKKDLATFGKKWFKPEEASSLRTKIRKLLVDEFQSARDSASSSVDNTPPKDED